MGKIKSKSILEMSADEAQDFLLKKESYSNIDLPDYIDFQPLLNLLSKAIKNRSLHEICEQNKKPSDYEEINHTFLSNKDGRFSWRPLKLIHPALYVLLVHKITDSSNWILIQKRLLKISEKVVTKIECKSWSRSSETKESDKAAQVSNWWGEIEQTSLKMSMDFSYIVHADVADCYGSIYTHSIPWAIHGRKKAKKERQNKKLIGNVIDSILQNISYGQTNGIPQGSILMDVIAEIVLSYVDLSIYTKLHDIDYKIIRYRDDYRIFTQNEADGLRILKVLTEVLANLGMKLNASKTISSDNLIKNSIKPDKWFLLDNLIEHNGLQRQLMFIHKLAESYPNSGSVKKELYKFYNERLHDKDSFIEDITVLIAIASDIAYKNPLTYPTVAAILSKLLSKLNTDKKIEIFNKIIKRFDNIPNTGFLDIWLQRVSITSDELSSIEFEEPLCKIIKDSNNKNDLLWEMEWLQEKFKKIFLTISIVNMPSLAEMKEKEVIDPEEIALFITTKDY